MLDQGQPQTQAAIFTRYGFYGQELQAAVTAPRWLLGRTWGQDSVTLKLEDWGGDSGGGLAQDAYCRNVVLTDGTQVATPKPAAALVVGVGTLSLGLIRRRKSA